MKALQVSHENPYDELKIELQICAIGGLFLALYDDERIRNQLLIVCVKIYLSNSSLF